MENQKVNPSWYIFLQSLVIFLLILSLSWWGLNVLESGTSYLVPSLQILLFLIVLLSFPISFYILRQREKINSRPVITVADRPKRTFTSILMRSISIGIYIFAGEFILTFLIRTIKPSVYTQQNEGWGLLLLLPLFLFLPLLSIIISFIIIKSKESSK